MLQIRVHGPDDWRLDDVDDPAPGPGDALVRVAACGICGTDVSMVRMGGLTGHPMCLGHEISGTVEWVGDDVADHAPGDRVVVRPSDAGDGPMGCGGPQGGLTPLLHVPDVVRHRRLFAVPGDMPLTTAALTEPLAVGMQAVNQVEARPGDRVAVFGCGPIGLMATATLADRGVDEVVAIDPSPARLELARAVGAAHTLQAGRVDVWEELKHLHGTAPFMFGPTAATDCFIEASGADAVLGDVLRNGRVGGRMAVVALHYTPVPVNFVDLLMKEFTVRGSMEYPERFEDALDLLARRDLSELVTHTLPLEEFGEGLRILGGSKDSGKVMVSLEGAR